MINKFNYYRHYHPGQSSDAMILAVVNAILANPSKHWIFQALIAQAS